MIARESRETAPTKEEAAESCSPEAEMAGERWAQEEEEEQAAGRRWVAE